MPATPSARPVFFANQFVTRMGAATMKYTPPERPMNAPDTQNCQTSVYVPMSASATMLTKNDTSSKSLVFTFGHKRPTYSCESAMNTA